VKISIQKLLLSLIIAFSISDIAFAAKEKSSNSVQTKIHKELWIENMTSPEIKTAIKKGYTNILIPTAGIEQNGQHIPLNKHQKVLEYTMPRIAKKMGNTLIAPIINFVPEGNIEHKEGHMAFAGTISMPSDVFQAILANTVKSLYVNGFKKFYLLGDSGGNQDDQNKIAEILRKQGFEVYAIPNYYANNVQNEYITQTRGYDLTEIGTHVGIRDTSEVMAVAPNIIRKDKITSNVDTKFIESGANGNATKASAKLGKELLDIKIEEALKEIEKY
jgi:creatinine amidohydrolase/Fe(II)-dependent formamide hydrolase-like protein